MASRQLEFSTESDEHRKQMLSFLDILEVSWPYEVKLAAAGVRHRLAQALDYAQAWDVVSPGKDKIDVNKLTTWSYIAMDTPVRVGTRRFSFEEDPTGLPPMRLTERRLGAQEDPRLLTEDKFEETLKEWPAKVNSFLSMRRM